MSKRICILNLMFLLLLALLFSWGTALEMTQQQISDAMIRLHVVANSDSDLDQNIKLEVRNAVLQEAQKLLKSAESAVEAKSLLLNGLDLLESAADGCLSENGSKYTAEVTLKRELFGTRHYEGFSLPGGYYDALCVTIGAGEGKNWWCVVYPQICLTATSAQQEAVAVMAGMGEEDIAIIQMESGEYELKFKTLELFENILLWFRTRGDGIPTSR